MKKLMHWALECGYPRSEIAGQRCVQQAGSGQRQRAADSRTGRGVRISPRPWMLDGN